MRIYLVDRLFNECNKKGYSTYISVGSKKITSDYDITVLGKDAPRICYCVFIKFLNIYHNTLPHVFDTNLYSVGYFDNRGSNNIEEKVKVGNYRGKEIFILVPKNNRENEVMLEYAFIRFLEAGIKETKYQWINKYLLKAKEAKKELDRIYRDALKKNKVNYPYYNLATLKILTRYQLAYKYSKKLYTYLYNKKQKADNNLLKISCMANYFQIEAYYTLCTVNVIVIKQQSDFKVNLSKINYLCSAIENYGELLKDCHGGKCKLLNRVYYSLGHGYKKSFIKKIKPGTRVNKKIQKNLLKDINNYGENI